MSDKTILFGIKNCDSVKKARGWLTARGVAHDFHDFRVDGLNKTLLQTWIDLIGPEQLINKRSTTWKQLSSKDQSLTMSRTASAVVLANPTLIKRPILQNGQNLLVGFDADEYDKLYPEH